MKRVLSAWGNLSVCTTDADGGQEVVAEFGGLGLWHFDDGAWSLISAINPEDMISEDID